MKTSRTGSNLLRQDNLENSLQKKNPEEVLLDGIMKVLGDARRTSISQSLMTGEDPTMENSPKVAMAIDVVYDLYKNYKQKPDNIPR